MRAAVVVVVAVNLGEARGSGEPGQSLTSLYHRQLKHAGGRADEARA